MIKMTTRTVSKSSEIKEPPAEPSHPLLIILSPPFLVTPADLTGDFPADILTISHDLITDHLPPTPSRPHLLLTSRLPATLPPHSSLTLYGFRLHAQGFEDSAERILQLKATGDCGHPQFKLLMLAAKDR